LDTHTQEIKTNTHNEVSNFTRAYEKICKILEAKYKHNLDTTIVITMIDLGRESQQEEWERLQEYYRDKDVYIYLKSQDQNWVQDGKLKTNSIDWSEFCHYPWSSLSVKSDGMVAVCNQDFNNMVIVGDITKNTLTEIWNSDKMNKFRMSHIENKPCEMCDKYCDKRLIGSL